MLFVVVLLSLRRAAAVAIDLRARDWSETTHTHTHRGRMGHVVYGSRVATAALGAGLVAALTPHAVAVPFAFIKFTAAADFITLRRHRRRDNMRADVVVAVANNTSDRSPRTLVHRVANNNAERRASGIFGDRRPKYNNRVR